MLFPISFLRVSDNCFMIGSTIFFFILLLPEKPNPYFERLIVSDFVGAGLYARLTARIQGFKGSLELRIADCGLRINNRPVDGACPKVDSTEGLRTGNRQSSIRNRQSTSHLAP